MGARERNLHELLLDLHLDRLSEQDRAWLDARLDEDRSLRAMSDRLGRLLQPLDHWTVPPPPPTLTEKVLERVQRQAHGRRTLAVGPTPDGSPRIRGRGIIPFPRMRDLVAVAACLLLLVAVFVPGVSEMRPRARRVVCASNLGAVYRGLTAYQESFAGVIPFAGGSEGSAWLPECAEDAPFASNSRHPYLLVKMALGPAPKNFVCPSDDGAVAMDIGGAGERNDFTLARNVSYDSRSLAGSSPILRPVKTTAYLADRNPLFVNARFNESVDPYTANSPAHRGRGQSILTLEGTVEYVHTPEYGPARDNPWIVGDLQRYKGTESISRPNDAFLIPGYPLTDPSVCDKLRR